MKNPTMKVITIGLTALLGSLLGLSAIERPSGNKPSEKATAQPRGGILRDDQKADKAERPKDADIVPKPMLVDKIAFLGVHGEASSEALRAHLELEGGLLLSTVRPTSPAGLAGLKELDIIVSVDDSTLNGQESLRTIIADYNPGDEVTLKIVRRGKTIEQKVTLGEAPALRNFPPQAIIPNPAADMDRLLNRQLENALGGLGNDKLQREMMKQLERALGNNEGGFKQFKFDFGGNIPGGKNPKMDFRGIGSMKFVDKDGSIEMKMTDGQRELAIRDKEGNLLFEGPYDSDIDKAAVPEEYRERVERLDNGGSGSGFRLKMNGRDVLPKRGERKEAGPKKKSE